MRRKNILLLLCLLCPLLPAAAQQYLGTPGLIHVATADMDSAGVARIGAHFTPKVMVPDNMTLDDEKFNTFTNYLSVSPFSWIEVGYGYTLWKMHWNLNRNERTGFYAKDRYFSLRLQPLREGPWWPAVVLGGNDVVGSGEGGRSGSYYYRNFYAAASKHFNLGPLSLGAHLAYRHWKREENSRWNGPVGGIDLRPAACPELRLMGEYDGDGINLGADYLLLRHFLLQASLQKGRYFSGGLCYTLWLGNL